MLYDETRDVTIDAEDWGTILKYANGATSKASCNAAFVPNRDGARGVLVRALRDIREHDEVVIEYGGQFSFVRVAREAEGARGGGGGSRESSRRARRAQ